MIITNNTSLVVNMILAFILVIVIFYQYANWRNHSKFVTFAVFISLYFSFLIIFILPLDITSTIYRDCMLLNTTLNLTCVQPLSYVAGDTLTNLWQIIYWSTQFLAWFLLPLMQSHEKAGEFHFKARFKSALHEYRGYLLSFITLLEILLVYCYFTDLNMWNYVYESNLSIFLSCAFNTWGLFLLVLLLGYALVDIPRELWLSGKRRHLLNKAYFKLSKLSVDKAEAEKALHDILDSLQIVNQHINTSHVLYQYLRRINQKIPSHVKQPMRRQSRVNEDINPNSYKTLVNLHSELIRALQDYGRTQTQWGMMVRQVVLLEDVEKNHNSREKLFVHSFPQDHTESLLALNPKMEWYWRCWVKPKLMRVLGVGAGCLSLAILWSEVTFFHQSPTLSLFYILLKRSLHTFGSFTSEHVMLVFIAYLCFCAYTTVFKIKRLNFAYLTANQLTDKDSLIYFGMLLCRLTPPLCVNFLGMIHMDSHFLWHRQFETYFTQVMGHIHFFSFITDKFNIYFPMLMPLFCLVTYSREGSMLLHESLIGDEVTTDLIDAGKTLITAEKQQRMEDTQGRQQELQEGFNTSAVDMSSLPVVHEDISRGPGSHSMKTNLLEAAAPIDGHHSA